MKAKVVDTDHGSTHQLNSGPDSTYRGSSFLLVTSLLYFKFLYFARPCLLYLLVSYCPPCHVLLQLVSIISYQSDSTAEAEKRAAKALTGVTLTFVLTKYFTSRPVTGPFI